MTKEKRFSFSGLSKPNAMNKPKKYTTSPSAEQFLLREKVDDGIHFYAHCKRGSWNPALASGGSLGACSEVNERINIGSSRFESCDSRC